MCSTVDYENHGRQKLHLFLFFLINFTEIFSQDSATTPLTTARFDIAASLEEKRDQLQAPRIK